MRSATFNQDGRNHSGLHGSDAMGAGLEGAIGPELTRM